MDIRIRETLYVSSGDTEYVVRTGALGVERKGLVHFFDNTKTVSVAFPKEFCLESQLFLVVRKMEDKDISLKEALQVLDQAEIDDQTREQIKFNLKSLA